MRSDAGTRQLGTDEELLGEGAGDLFGSDDAWGGPGEEPARHGVDVMAEAQPERESEEEESGPLLLAGPPPGWERMGSEDGGEGQSGDERAEGGGGPEPSGGEARAGGGAAGTAALQQLQPQQRAFLRPRSSGMIFPARREHLGGVGGEATRMAPQPPQQQPLPQLPPQLAPPQQQQPQQQQPQQQQPQQQPPQQRAFDPAVAARHEYLGDFEELPGGCTLLEEGGVYTLPALPLPDVVLMPGSTLPLKLVHVVELRVLDEALGQPPATRRLMVVVHQRRYAAGGLLEDGFACTAEIRQLRRQADGSAYVVAIGRQRVARLEEGAGERAAVVPWRAWDTGFRMRVRVLPEAEHDRLPRHLASGDAHWPAWAARPFDAGWLAARARAACGALLPAAGTHCGGPAELS
ncbi:hypothetical protein FOA52_007244 [Chlamydomonas sp. UWO 241]|nr:hypothetical protein FOA52_007244 [Chlamydomonas sp. UWO 241]